jgi:hypothetical protein
MQSSSNHPKISPDILNHHLDLYEKLDLAVFPVQSAEPDLPDEVRMLAAKMPVHLWFLHLANRSWWWRRWMRKRLQNTNLGVCTGRRFNLIIMDFDFHKGSPPLSSFPELPPTLTVKTAFGIHLYFRLPKNAPAIPTTHNVFAQGVDVRGEFCFVAAPPSIHASGAQYHFENPDMAMAVLPDSIIQRLRSCEVTRFFYLHKFHRNFYNIRQRAKDARRQKEV